MKVITDSGEIVMGVVEATPTIGITDYSKRVTNDFGVTTVVKRDFSRRMSVRMVIPQGEVDEVQRQLADLRAKEAQWIADERFAWLSVTGFYRDFEIDIPGHPISWCRLEVEGLAESEPGADDGTDPAPDGMQSTLRLLQPIKVDDNVLTSSSVAEDDYTPWSASTNYVAGARVIAGHRIYESVAGDNLGHDPADGDGYWVDIGPTNRWAMFDEALGTATTANGSIVVTLDVTDADAVALLDVVGETVRVQAPGYDTTQPVGEDAITFLDLPVTSGSITVTIAGTGEVSAGTLLIGSLKPLGVTKTTPSVGINDYSRKETDDFGEPIIVERAWAKRMSIDAAIRTGAIDTVANRIAWVRAQPCLWIADDDLDSLTVYGFFNDFAIEVGQTLSNLSLSIEGLSKAPVIPDRTPTMPDAELWSLADGATADGIPALIVAGVCDFPGTDSVLIEYRRVGAADWIARGKFDALSPVRHVISPVDGAADYEARVAYQNRAGVGPWLVLANVTTPSMPIGQDGLNSATVFLYQRAAVAPAVPVGDTTYTFATGELTGALGGWTRSLPEHNANPVWFTSALASSTEATDTIATGDWSTPRILAADGPPGDPGAPAVTIRTSAKAFGLWAYTNGNVIDYSKAHGQLQVFSGATDVTAAATLSATPSAGVTGTINTAPNNPVAGQPKGYFRVTNLANETDLGTLTLAAEYGGQTLTEIVSIVKTRGGPEIVDTLPTTELFPDRTVTYQSKLWIYKGAPVNAWVPFIDVDSALDGAMLDPQTVTFSKLAVVPGNINPDLNFRDPSFWSAGEGWYIEDGAGFPTGRYYALWSGTGYTGTGNTGIQSQLVDSPPPGQIVRLSATCRNDSNSVIAFAAQFHDRTGTFISNGGVVGQFPANSGLSTQSVQITVPDGASKFFFFGIRFGGPAFSGAVRFGAFRMDIAASASLIVDGNVLARHVGSEQITTDKLAAGAVTASRINVTQLSAITATIGTLRTATVGARMEISDNVLKVFDASNVLRVKLGNLDL